MLSLPLPEAQASLDAIDGIGPVRQKRLSRLGLDICSDLLFHLPFRYEDWRPERDSQRLVCRDEAAVVGKVDRVQLLRGSPRRTMVEISAEMADQAHRARAILYGRRFLHRRLSPGQRIAVYGSWKRDTAGVLQCAGVQLDEDPQHAIIPIYPATEGLSSRRLWGFVRGVLQSLLPHIPQVLPDSIINTRQLLPLPDALCAVHLPQTPQQIEQGKRSLAFVEMIIFQLALEVSRRQWVQAPGFIHRPDGNLASSLIEELPFDLTCSQHEALQQIRGDMRAEAPMYRLLQGDVGSGKTIVAILATLDAVECGYQAVWLVPTRILANQHHRTLRSYLQPLGVSVQIVTSEDTQSQRAQSEPGSADVIVGTHALLQNPDDLGRLSFLLIDEQQRFGVRQREKLQRLTPHPDVLMLSATPIPRTLARTVYGGLRVSTLTDMPLGRRKTKTKIVPRHKRPQVYQFVKKCTDRGMGAYVVCSEIEPSDRPDELTAAVTWVEQLQTWLPDAQIDVIHGRMDQSRREGILQRFAGGELDVLVGTTVLEVGVDIPRAAVMVVEDAGQFGLSELHQLRGRIGRAGQDSFCFLVESKDEPEKIRKLQILRKADDGMEVARMDLKRRGMGSFFSSRQHGMPPFVMSDQLQDPRLRKDAISDAAEILRGRISDDLVDMAEHIYGESLLTAQVR